MNLIALMPKRLLDVPAEIRRNDERIRNCDEDLASWVERAEKQLEIDHRRIQTNMAAAGQLYSGARLNARQHAREQVLSRYEEQRRDAERVVRDAQLSERWPHRPARKLGRRPLLTLTAPDRIAPTIERWQLREPLPGDVGEAA